jgi:hypothetical protein
VEAGKPGVSKLDTKGAIELASEHLLGLREHVFDVLTITAPVSPTAAVNLAKVVSKLSPILGNLIEFNTVEYLNLHPSFKDIGYWKRQDPGFPDTVFVGGIAPAPGFEIKAWFPLATEITARFRDSQDHFKDDRTYVVLLAWLPEFLIYGRPVVLDLVVVSGASMAKARDDHYHNAPDYLVIEPNDTSARTANLQQTNTSGHKFQGTPEQRIEAEVLARALDVGRGTYSTAPEFQAKVLELMSRFPYRLDTNYAKMDRIAHLGVEKFKSQVLATKILERTVLGWARLFNGEEAALGLALGQALTIKWEKTLVEPSKGPVE